MPPENADLVEVPPARYRTGVAFGVGVPTTNGFGTSRLVVGADFYVVQDDEYDFGASYTTGGKQVETGRRWRANFVGGELNYKKPQIAPGFYVGAAAGVVSFGGGDAFLPGIDYLYLGPKAGLIRMFTRNLSFGFETKLLLVSTSPLLAWLDVLGSVRYHF